MGYRTDETAVWQVGSKSNASLSISFLKSVFLVLMVTFTLSPSSKPLQQCYCSAPASTHRGGRNYAEELVSDRMCGRIHACVSGKKKQPWPKEHSEHPQFSPFVSGGCHWGLFFLLWQRDWEEAEDCSCSGIIYLSSNIYHCDPQAWTKTMKNVLKDSTDLLKWGFAKGIHTNNILPGLEIWLDQ